VTVDEIADRYLRELLAGGRHDLSTGVRDLMRTDVATVSADVLIEEAQRLLIEAKGPSIVVVDDDDRVVGLATRTDFLRRQRRRIVLVDHSQRAQSVEGLEMAEVVEVVDHHNIGDVMTGTPIFYLADPVGATATLIAEMYLDPARWFHLPHPERVALDTTTAGLLLSAIISDTLLLRSPTTTVRDRRALATLAERTGIDVDALAQEMFAARSDISARTAQDLVGNDYKPYEFGGKSVGVAQVDVMSLDAVRGRYDELRTELAAAKARQGLDISVLMMTDIIGEATDLLFDPESRPVIERAFGVQASGGYAHLPGVVSRKKQLIPPLSAAL
jgi:manganese-dependent inorganic pyrophosphatase